jgi:hypothetical protein
MEGLPMTTNNVKIMPYSIAKTILKQLKALVNSQYNHDQVKTIYDQYDWTQYKTKNDFSPLYNQFTAHFQKWKIQIMKVGEKDGLYYDQKSKKVITWTGKPIGKIESLSFYESGGFAPCKRVSITFKYRNMKFRGICSYKSMECFTFKRIA